MMNNRIGRRQLPLLALWAAPAAPAAPEAGSQANWTAFPRQDDEWVRDVVGAAHRDLARVKELVDEHPALANATLDWGFGDWETALGAAAHTGRREIAEYLLNQGARLDIFAAAMLGMTETVKAMVQAIPGVERTVGPHGIPLLAHARAGGDKAKETLAFLQTLPGSSRGIPMEPFDDGRRQQLTGQYQFEGGGPKAEIKLTSPAQLSLQVGTTVPRFIHHGGQDEFYPAGAGRVRIRFLEGASGFTLTDGRRLLRAVRIGG
jgi:hypothetical protein